MRRFLLRAAAFALIFALVAEAFFRVVVPARETPLPWQTPREGLRCYDAAGPIDGIFTSGRLAEQRARWQINPQCWNAPRPYLPAAERDRPVIAVAGDSQIEGFYVDAEAHLAARLTTLGGGAFETYAYGGSGYKLGQYLLLARYLAAEHIDPAVLVVFINRGDFAHAIDAFGARPQSMLTFTWRDGVVGERPPLPYAVQAWRRELRNSALARYLVFNARLNPFRDAMAEPGVGGALEEDALVHPAYADILRHAIDGMRMALPTTKLAFVCEAGPIPTSALIARECAARDCGHLDLTDAFAHNPHWNAEGHRLVATTLHAWLAARGWLPR
ncbi:MAG: hypothetical protein KC620_22560 [Myxococcales bacterium]|nr:hypothetical protein [Myxococcales bacterium]